MSAPTKQAADPSVGVAPVSVATTYGQPGGHVLTEADVPELLLGGRPFEEIAALQLTSASRLRQIAERLVREGRLPAERFDFLP
jgi:hypothetical protein